MAHGFRWEVKPQSAAPAKKRAKRKAATAVTPPDVADTRSTAWPAISVPPVEPESDAPRPEEEPDQAEQDPADDGGAAATPAREEAPEAEEPVSPLAEGSTAGLPE